MLSQKKPQMVPGWSFILMTLLLLLVAVSLFFSMSGIDMSIGQTEWSAQPEEEARAASPSSVELLRAARPDFAGGFVPESTIGERMVPVELLRAARPDFAGGFVPESTMGERTVPVELLRAARPDFAGGFVPESTIGE